MVKFDYKILTYFYSNWAIVWYCLYILEITKVSPFISLGFALFGYIFIYALFLSEVLSFERLVLVFMAHLIPMFFVPPIIGYVEFFATVTSLIMYLMYLEISKVSPYSVYGVWLPSYIKGQGLSKRMIMLALPYLVAVVVTVVVSRRQIGEN